MLLQFFALGVTRSWDDGFPGARASRPHQAWHSLGHLPHLDQPGTAPWLSYGLAAAVPADRVAACSIALKLSAGQRDSMRAGRPRSQVQTGNILYTINREHGLHLSTIHESVSSCPFVDIFFCLFVDIFS